jgi:hypothetical protein
LQIEKEDNQKNYRLINYYFWYPTLQSFSNIYIIASSRRSSKIFKNIQQTLLLKKILMPSSYDIRIRQNWYCQNHKYKSFKETKKFHVNFSPSCKVLKQQMTNFWVSIFLGIKSTCIIGSEKLKKTTYTNFYSLYQINGKIK